VQDGQKIRLAGQGQPGRDGGPNGDLLVEVRVAAHAGFKRKGNDVYGEATINMAQAALGTRVRVPTVSGEAVVRVPPGTQPETTLRLRGHGIRSADGVAGDHYVTLHVTVPQDLTPAQQEALRKFAKEAGIPTE
jgi:molecular chaperone DnaJ